MAKKHATTMIVANRTNEMRTSVTMTITPRTGIASDDTGSDSGTTSKNTIKLSNSVVTKPILSPLSGGIQKLNKVRIAKMAHGAKM